MELFAYLFPNDSRMPHGLRLGMVAAQCLHAAQESALDAGCWRNAYVVMPDARHKTSIYLRTG